MNSEFSPKLSNLARAQLSYPTSQNTLKPPILEQTSTRSTMADQLDQIFAKLEIQEQYGGTLNEVHDL